MIVNKNGNLLEVDKDGLLDIIKNNVDGESNDIDKKLFIMIMRFYGRLSFKQTKWIMEKCLYIIRHNNKYKGVRGIKNIIFYEIFYLF
jgi:hypothetical protein